MINVTYSINTVFDCGVVDPDEFLEWFMRTHPEELEEYIQEYIDEEDSSNEDESDEEIEYACKIDNKHLEYVFCCVDNSKKWAEWRQEICARGLLGGEHQFEKSRKKTLKRVDGGFAEAFGLCGYAKVFDNVNGEYGFRTIHYEDVWLSCVIDEDTHMMFFIPDEYVVRV